MFITGQDLYVSLQDRVLSMLQKKLAELLFSTKLMAVLFITFVLAMAVGTFVENSYTTTTAREWIHNA